MPKELKVLFDGIITRPTEEGSPEVVGLKSNKCPKFLSRKGELEELGHDDISAEKREDVDTLANYSASIPTKNVNITYSQALNILRNRGWEY